MVAYERYRPPGRQRDLIEHYWVVKGPPSTVVRQEILIPNGRPGLAVALADPGVRRDPLSGAEWPNVASVFGIMTRPHLLAQSGVASYAGVEFTPWGLAGFGFTGHLVDDVLPLAEWIGPAETGELTARLRAAPFGRERAELLAAFLGPRLREVPRRAVVAEAIRVVDRTAGRVTVAEVAERTRMSYSTLYRVFREALGIGPKQYAELIRYYHFVGGLLGGPADATATLAALHGYYDQAHAARDFKRYTGISARRFREVQNGIAALMHGRSVQDGAAAER